MRGVQIFNGRESFGKERVSIVGKGDSEIKRESDVWIQG
jgi:hypothetical protein